MLKLVKWSEDANFMFPNSDLASGEVILQKYPAVTHFPHVLEINGDVCQAVMSLAALRELHGVDPALSEEEAITALEEIINAVPPEPEPSAEERIAAALELQNLTTLGAGVAEDTIERNYAHGLWDAAAVALAVQKNAITQSGFQQITGQKYSTVAAKLAAE